MAPFFGAANLSEGALLLLSEAVNGSDVATTASLSKTAVKERQTEFGIIIGGCSALLLLGGVIVFFVKTRKPGGKAKTGTGGTAKPDEKAYTRIPGETPADEEEGGEDSEDGMDEGFLDSVGVGLGAISEDEMLIGMGRVNSAEEKRQKDEWLMKNAERVREKHAVFMERRWWILSLCFVLYVGVSLGLPTMHKAEVTCGRGFFWEVHMQFFAAFAITKVMELWLCLNDPTLEFSDVGVFYFLWQFFASFFGYVDAYTDATGIVIAYSCPDSLAQVLSLLMLVAYVVGVVLAQWLCNIGSAAHDPSHACFMKMLHMDLLASMVTLPPDRKALWDRIAMARTCCEDIPQALLQVVYIVKVKKNPFMIVSVCMAVASSVMALRDARARALATAGAVEAFENRERRTELYTCSQDGTIRCWDVVTGGCKRIFRAQGDGYGSSPANHIVATRGVLYSSHDDGRIRQWSLETGGEVTSLEHMGNNGCICGNLYFLYSWANGDSCEIKEWSLETHTHTRSFGMMQDLYAMCLGDGVLYTTCVDMPESVAEWSLASEHQSPPCVRQFSGHDGYVSVIRATKKRLFTGSLDNTVREWSLETGETTRIFEDHGGVEGFPHSYIFIHENHIYIPLSSRPGAIMIWSLETGKRVSYMEGHYSTALGMAVLDGKLYSGSHDGTILEFDLSGEKSFRNIPQVLRRFEGHQELVNDVVIQIRDLSLTQ